MNSEARSASRAEEGSKGRCVKTVHCFGSGELPPGRPEAHGNPYPVETAIFRLEGSNVALEVTRSLFQTVRPYTEAFFIYGFVSAHEDDLGRSAARLGQPRFRKPPQVRGGTADARRSPMPRQKRISASRQASARCWWIIAFIQKSPPSSGSSIRSLRRRRGLLQPRAIWLASGRPIAAAGALVEVRRFRDCRYLLQAFELPAVITLCVSRRMRVGEGVLPAFLISHSRVYLLGLQTSKVMELYISTQCAR